MMDALLELKDTTVTYPDGTRALDGFSLAADDGDSIALVGENGAGKTSALLTAVGILEAVSGYVEADGVRLSKKTVNAVRQTVQMVFQNPDDQLFMPYIYDDAAFGVRNAGLPEDEVALRVAETLETLNIGHLRDRSSLMLSGGEKRLAAIATVLAMRPKVLLFDEPTAFLDHKARRALIITLNALRQTKIIATHDMAFAAETCRRVCIIKKGRAAADGPITLLYDENLMESCGLAALKKE